MIKLWDGWAIDADQYQYILGIEATGTIKGKEITYLDKATYHKTLAQALNAFMERIKRQKVAEKDMTLLLAVQYLQEIEHSIQCLIREAGLGDALYSTPLNQRVFRSEKAKPPEDYDPYDL